jgi:NADH-quinone oxidoreductase subunit J
MSGADLLFYLFASLTLLSGLLVVVNPFSRNPVTSAMFLVLTMVFLSGLFVMLHAFFLAAVQILVYAGAVMVLFLFVIMLLDIKAEEQRKIKLFSMGLGGASVGGLLLLILISIFQGEVGQGGYPRVEGNTANLGELLFTNYLLPFEIVSVLLLVAMVGAILLSKKDLK